MYQGARAQIQERKRPYISGFEIMIPFVFLIPLAYVRGAINIECCDLVNVRNDYVKDSRPR